jgi:hypothetical protein
VPHGFFRKFCFDHKRTCTRMIRIVIRYMEHRCLLVYYQRFGAGELGGLGVSVAFRPGQGGRSIWSRAHDSDDQPRATLPLKRRSSSERAQ